MTLLEKAKQIKLGLSGSRKVYTEEEIELALAWLKNDVRLIQVAEVTKLKVTGNNTYRFLAGALRQAFQHGEISIKK